MAFCPSFHGLPDVRLMFEWDGDGEGGEELRTTNGELILNLVILKGTEYSSLIVVVAETRGTSFEFVGITIAVARPKKAARTRREFFEGFMFVRSGSAIVCCVDCVDFVRI